MKRLVCGISLLVWVFPAFGAGMRTHVEMVDRALRSHLGQAEAMLPGIAKFLADPEVVRALYCGAIYPDWGYDGINQNAAEASHWWGYQQRYLAHLRKRSGPRWDASTRRSIAFFIGALTHGVTDIPWHFSTAKQQSFLAMSQRKDGAGHGKTEVSVDLFCHGGRPLSQPMRRWWWPYQDLLAGFKPVHKASRAQLVRGRNRQVGLWYAAALLGGVPTRAARSSLPWTLAHYQDYYYGGVDHGAAVSAMLIRHYYALFRGWRVQQQSPDYGKRSPGCLSGRGLRETRIDARTRQLARRLPPGEAKATLWLHLASRQGRQTRLIRIAGQTIRPTDKVGRWYRWDMTGKQQILLRQTGDPDCLLQFDWSDAFSARHGTALAYRPLLVLRK